MPYIELSGKRGKGHRALVDEDIKELYGGLSWFLSDTGYAVRRSDRRDDSTKMTIRLHRLIMNAPEGMVVDHLNGDSLDNRRSNLRVCTQGDNAKNRHGTVGYCWDSSKGKYQVRYRGKFYGRYRTETEAKDAYARAKSGVRYSGPGFHPRRRYLPTGVLYMRSRSAGGSPYYIRPQRNGIKHFHGFYATVEQAENAYKLLIGQLDKEDKISQGL